MKAWHVVILSVALGTALGAGMSWANFHNSPPLVTEVVRPNVPRVADGTGPKVLVDTPTFDFGPVDRDSTIVHVFKITNAGEAPLELEAGSTTCSRCTIASLDKSRLAPGESTGVRVEFSTTNSQPRFRQHATIRTNDPALPTLDLTISGVVTSRFRIVPESLVLSKVSANETKAATVRIYGYVSDDITVAKHEFTSQESARFFEVASEPIPQDQLAEPDARSGCRLLVTLKPGLPLGPIRQTIRLELQMAGVTPNPMVDLPIEGTIDSDISIVGRDWNADAARLRIGDVPRAKGAKRELFLVLRGPKRNEVTVTPGKVDPAWIKVTVGKAEPWNVRADGEGGVTRIPLTIEIPPGAPVVNHLGGEQAKYAEVILETTHPDVAQIRMHLQFIVLQ